MTTISYASLPPVSRDFLLDFDSPILALGGPIGTGKTFVGALRILLKAIYINPMADGVRRSSFIVVRKRYGDLEQSAIPALKRVFGEAFEMSGKRSPMYGQVRVKDERGFIEVDIWLYAFETRADVEKIRSLSFTDGMIIEGQELEHPSMITDIYKRCGRFPTPENADDNNDFERNPLLEYHWPDGRVSYGRQLFLDFNYTDTRHWLYDYLVTSNPVRHDGTRRRALYQQPATHVWVPGGVLSEAHRGVYGRYRGEEGAFIRNLDAVHYIKHQGWTYWEEILEQSIGDDAKIERDVLAKFGESSDGKPVYPQFSRETHVVEQALDYIPGLPVFVGVDNGLNNAWIFCQQARDGMLYVIDEIVNVGDDAKPIRNALEQDITPYINNTLLGFDIAMILDQAFWSREGGEGRTQVELLSNAGYKVFKCPHKFTGPIREATSGFIARRMLRVAANCTALIDALSGGFCYPMNRVTGQYLDSPNQTSVHSHPANAFEFVCAKLAHNGHDRRKPNTRSKREFSYI